MEQANSKEFERFWRETQLVRANVSNETFALLQPCVFHAGEYLYTEGEATDMLYLMLEGSCKVFKLLENGKSADTVCGLVRNLGREGQTARVLSLAQLESTAVDMFTTVYIGNTATKQLGGKMVTPRGYRR